MAIRIEAANTEGLTRTTGILSVNADYTRCLWIRPRSIGARQTLFWAGVTGNLSADWDYIESDGLLHVRGLDVAGSTIDNAAGSTTLVADTDYYVRVHRNGTNVSLYLNALTSAEVSATISTAGRAATALENIGLESVTGAPGNIAFDYERCWASNLTASNSAAERLLATAGQASPYRDCALTAHTDLTDASGNGRNWTAVGTLSTEANPPTIGGGGGKVSRGGVDLDGLGGVGQQRFPRAE